MLRYLLPTSLAFILAPLAHAQDTKNTDDISRIYTPEDFARYAPRTALDMVQQIPGFALNDNEDDGSRGFGQASSNVLLNGQRVSGKSNGVRDALGRVTAENVERIEIVDGASLDIPGLSGQVANVIAAATTGVSGTWEWESRVRENLSPYFDAVEISASGKRDFLGWTLGFESNPRRGGARGQELEFDAAGNIIETRQEDFNFIGTRPSVSGSLAWTPANGHIANLNASYLLWQPNIKEVSVRTPADGSSQINRLFQRSEDEWTTEIGGDYDLGMGPGRLKFIGLYRFEHSPFKNRVFEAAVDGSTAEESLFNQTVDEAETILRTEYSWSPRSGVDWQISAEGAFNVLESETDSFEALNFGPLGPDQETDPTARVEEARGEVSVTYGQKMSDKLTLQTSLGAEVSEISQSGGELGTLTATQTFTRPKGYVSAAYTVREGYAINARLERKVGQLNFFDFIASSDINDGNGQDANPDLSPQQSWYGEVEIERDFGAWGAASVKLSGEEIEDLVDRVLLPNGGDGIGNIDRASAIGLEFSTTLKLDSMGWTGVQIEASGNFRESSVTDPVTGADRRINNDHIHNWEIDLRHDIPNTDYAWGIGSERHVDGTRFFLDQTTTQRDNPAFAWIFAEHKNLFGMTATATFGNLFDAGETRRANFYATDRTGFITSREERERKFGPIFTFGLSGSF